MAKREFLMLAHKYDIDKHHIGGWYASEKLDGVRAFWDGGISRGKDLNSIPFANTEKDGRYIVQPKATGLWTRYGKPIQAPNFWLDKLPRIPLDGELWMGRGNFQTLISTVKQLNPDARWQNITYKVFDSPPYRIVLGDAEINLTNFRKSWRGALEYFGVANCPIKNIEFRKVLDELLEHGNEIYQIHNQILLPNKNLDARAAMYESCDKIVAEGGEGLMLRHPTSFWVPQRSHQLLKVKPYIDDEGTVVGYIWGRATDKGSKLLGKMGAMIVKWKDKTFELSGFTDQEREIFKLDPNLNYHAALDQAIGEGSLHPGEKMNVWEYANKHFPIGTIVNFRYRELTDSGIPKEARFNRIHHNA